MPACLPACSSQHLCVKVYAACLPADLKPGNVLLKTDPAKQPPELTAKLCDFGLVATLRGDNTHVSNYRAGTPLYMAPEVLSSGKLSQASDVYAFGVLLWELCAGQRCYEVSPADGSVVMSRAFGTFPPITDPAYVALFVRCLARSPRERPSFKDVLMLLETIGCRLRYTGHPPTSLPPGLMSLPHAGDEFGPEGAAPGAAGEAVTDGQASLLLHVPDASELLSATGDTYSQQSMLSTADNVGKGTGTAGQGTVNARWAVPQGPPQPRAAAPAPTLEQTEEPPRGAVAPAPAGAGVGRGPSERSQEHAGAGSALSRHSAGAAAPAGSQCVDLRELLSSAAWLGAADAATRQELSLCSAQLPELLSRLEAHKRGDLLAAVLAAAPAERLSASASTVAGAGAGASAAPTLAAPLSAASCGAAPAAASQAGAASEPSAAAAAAGGSDASTGPTEPGQPTGPTEPGQPTRELE